MSNVKTDSQSESFTAKLDIHMVSTGTFRRLIDVYAGTRVVLAAMGASGIGKTAIPRQATLARGPDVPYVDLHMPTMSIEDFHVPTKAEDTRHYYDRRIPRKFQPLFAYCETERKKHKDGIIPPERCPILSIEELNRSVDKHVTRATFVLLDERVIGDMKLPDEVQMVVTMNPTGGGMSVNEFEKDPAMRRRLIIVGVTYSYGDFMRYAKGKFHPKVIEHIEAQPTLLYDKDGAGSGKAFACPATWEAVSRLCTALDRAKISLTSSEAMASFAGTIGATATAMFVEFIKDATIVITPEEVLQGYNKGSTVQQRFLKLIEDSRQDKITTLVTSVVLQIFADPDRKPSTYAAPFSNFLLDLPEENMMVLLREFFTAATTATDGKKTLIEVNKLLVKIPSYTSAVEKLRAAQDRGKAEASR